MAAKLDTGAEVNVLPLHHYKKLTAAPPLQQCNTVLTAFGGAKYKACGKTNILMKLAMGDEAHTENFIVADVEGDLILGGDTLLSHKLVNINLVNVLDSENKLIQEYPDLFNGKLGKSVLHAHHFSQRKRSPSCKCSPRKVPVAMKPKILAELTRMEKLGVIRKIHEPTDWVSSMVIVHKPDGAVRVCIDPFHLNKAIKRQHYPMNTIEEITAKLAGAKFFTKLDAVSGFWQIPLDEKSSRLCTFNTPWGRFRFCRLPFGIADASEVFQRLMCEHFSENAEVVVDDLLVWGKNREEHDRKLQATLQKAQEIGLVFNKKKLKVAVQEVSYVGHIFTEHGIRSDPGKVAAIRNMPEPKDRAAVMRLLGMVTYLAKFIPDLSAITAPLRQVIKKC